jgi:hypothetical protein
MKKHGHTWKGGMTRTYRAWINMGQRVRPNFPHREYYFDRGIVVCLRWKIFESFLADMGECPAGYYLDRTDNDKGYGPDNCRWVTPRTSMMNRSVANLIEHKNQRRNITEWAESIGITPKGLEWRLANWTIEKALSMPVRPHPCKGRRLAR